MATKSILKEVRFKNKNLCAGFVRALENAQDQPKGRDVVISRRCETVKKDHINSFFEGN